MRLNRKSQTAHKQETEKPDEDIADRFGDRGYKGTEKKDSLGGLRRGECGNGLQRKDGQGTAKNQKPDLIVCCTEIAEDGGEALLTELRSTVPNAGIILTGSRFSEEIFRRLLYVEAVDYLKKPVSEEAFFKAVERFKERRFRQQEETEEKQYGRYWKNNQRMIQEMFWKKLCLNRIPGGPEEIEAAAAQVDAKLDKDSRYRMVLITLANEDEMKMAWGDDLCQAAIQNLARHL